MEKDRLGRREFLVLGFDIAAATGIAAFLGPRLYPFVGLLNRPEGGSIKPEDFVGFIETEDQKVHLENIGPKTVSLNKEAFAQALYDASSLLLPEGPEKLYSLLKGKHLKVSFSPVDVEPEMINGEELWLGGRYFNYLDIQMGPEIIFYPKFLTEYYMAQGLGDSALLQKGPDETVGHEIAHLVQDLRNPFRNPFPGIMFKLKRIGAKLEWVEDPNLWDLPYEVEADEIASQIVEAKLANYMNNLEEPWPFGKFFIFT